MVLAARGARNLDGGDEAIEDEGEMAELRRQARRVYVESVLLAAVLTLLCLVG